jgi:primary-amine oxidase
LTSRAINHIKHLLDLITQFPKTNPSASEPSELDIPKLFRQIRSRYKALCSSLGIKPSLRAAEEEVTQDDLDDPVQLGGLPRRPVWKLENARPMEQGLSF